MAIEYKFTLKYLLNSNSSEEIARPGCFFYLFFVCYQIVLQFKLSLYFYFTPIIALSYQTPRVIVLYMPWVCKNFWSAWLGKMKCTVIYVPILDILILACMRNILIRNHCLVGCMYGRLSFYIYELLCALKPNLKVDTY